ncbi:hypothetical protein [Rhizobium lusitanum]|uniref:hypothetical protein n=1 Tax=Rhizobium lusitanum TaxID=293958 RepID=UPI00195B8D3F|nr:hypothetical protein [Rhizobium lusitanum]MBM7048363.1 hypothetical protein [Rhizobium lusitanum]
MAKLRDLIKSLIDELEKMQTPNASPEKIGGKKVMSGFISAGDGIYLVLSQKMEGLIAEIARVLKQNDPPLALSHTDDEWRQMVRTSFGPALTGIDLADDPDKSADIVLSEVRNSLSDYQTDGIQEYAFGCTFFRKDVAPFAVGPVRIEPRFEWLERKVEDGSVSLVTGRRVRKKWLGHQLRRRKSVIGGMRETDILDAIGGCKFVCSVTTNGLASQAGKLKAQTAARLALTFIALWWQMPSTALDGFNLLIDRSVRTQRSLLFVPGKIRLAGGTMIGRPHGPPITDEEWKVILTEHHREFEVMGELIEFYISPTGKVGRPKLMNALAQALLWFHEGCREQVDLMAIVNFAATLDALASGRESGGILKLIKARLGVNPDDKFRSNGQTMKQAVEEVYGKGRSRTVHGTNEQFGHDWTSTRQLAEVLARYCLLSCLTWAGSNANDDPKLLMQ